MIVVYAGRRPSEPPDDRFPATSEEWVARQLHRLLEELRPRLVVGSAAAGTDLLVLAAARAAGARAEVFVTGDVDEFCRVSVADKGGRWVAEFRARVAETGVTVRAVPGAAADDAGFAAVTEAMWARAREAATASGEELVAVVVSTGGRDGADRPAAPDHTEMLADAATASGHRVIRVDPANRP